MTPTPGFRSAEVGSFLAQVGDLSCRLATNTRGLTPARLEWQPRPGMNTVGMLLERHAGRHGQILPLIHQERDAHPAA